MKIERAKELIAERAKDLRLIFNLDDIKSIVLDDAIIVWLKSYNGIDNVSDLHVDITKNEYTLHIRIPELVFIIWHSGIVYDKVKSITLPNSVKI